MAQGPSQGRGEWDRSPVLPHAAPCSPKRCGWLWAAGSAGGEGGEGGGREPRARAPLLAPLKVTPERPLALLCSRIPKRELRLSCHLVSPLGSAFLGFLPRSSASFPAPQPGSPPPSPPAQCHERRTSCELPAAHAGMCSPPRDTGTPTAGAPKTAPTSSATRAASSLQKVSATERHPAGCHMLPCRPHDAEPMEGMRWQ